MNRIISSKVRDSPKIEKCLGISSSKQRCKRYPKKGEKYCVNHMPKKDFQNKECPICLCTFEKSGDSIILGCGHKIHTKGCLTGLSKFNCPVCRTNINKSDLKKEWVKKISSNRNDFQEYIKKLNDNLNEEISREQSMRQKREEEIQSAISFLIKKGVPLEYIPERIIVELEDHPLQVPPDYYASLIFRTTFSIYKKGIKEIVKNNTSNDKNINLLRDIVEISEINDSIIESNKYSQLK